MIIILIYELINDLCQIKKKTITGSDSRKLLLQSVLYTKICWFFVILIRFNSAFHVFFITKLKYALEELLCDFAASLDSTKHSKK